MKFMLNKIPKRSDIHFLSINIFVKNLKRMHLHSPDSINSSYCSSSKILISMVISTDPEVILSLQKLFEP